MKRMLGRVGLACALGLSVVGFPGAGAAPAGCVATAPVAASGVSTNGKCVYVVTGTTGGYVAATANPWKITMERRVRVRRRLVWKVVYTLAGGYTKPTTPAAGQLPLKKGYRVTVVISNLCNPASASQCGAAGFVGVGNA